MPELKGFNFVGGWVLIPELLALTIALTVYTALSLGRPALGEGLQRQFLEPFIDRVFGDYIELDFLGDLHRNTLPHNIHVEQFFMQPGSLLNSPPAQ